jgi:hypothetical protein
MKFILKSTAYRTTFFEVAHPMAVWYDFNFFISYSWLQINFQKTHEFH